MHPIFIPTAMVAAWLAVSPQAFLQRLPRLIEGAGFPEPMPHSRRPLLFRRDRVLAWIEERGLPRAEAAPARPQGRNVILLEEARTA
ncbi:MAG TPA: hypothetical protein PKD10_05320 [Paracoccaceae bacterium]|nr:hypothetical protein [Paracoccaceae bacterium]HMO70113.1 hypothetical protein [Paracoccaceae bacterium]